MSKKLNESDFSTHLAEQICFLQSSAKLYDAGNEIEAKRMATTLRILLYQSPNPKSKSQSLLGQMHLRKSMKFVSTAQPYQANNLLTQQCLLYLNFSNGKITFYPPLGKSHAYLCNLQQWANEIVLTDFKRNTYRRKDIITLLANKDGGAHVDAEIPDDLEALKSPNVTAWFVARADGTQQTPENDAVYASMRQMAFEVLTSLYEVRPAAFREKYF